MVPLTELVDSGDIINRFETRAFAVIALAVIDHPINPSFAAEVFGAEMGAETTSDVRAELWLTASTCLKERLYAIQGDLGDIESAIIGRFVSDKQEEAGRELHGPDPLIFSSTDHYLHFVSKLSPVKAAMAIFQKTNYELWDALKIHRAKHHDHPTPAEPDEELRVHAFHKALTAGNWEPPIYYMVSRVKRRKSIVEKIAGETEAALKRREDCQIGKLKYDSEPCKECLGEKYTPRTCLDKAIIDDIGGITIVTPTKKAAEELKEDIPEQEFLELKAPVQDYYDDIKKSGGYQAYHLAVAPIPINAQQHGDTIEIQIVDLEQHLKNYLIGRAQRNIYEAQRAGSGNAEYNKLVGLLTPLIG